MDSNILGALDFKALDVWRSFLEFIMLSKGSCVHSLDFSKCTRSIYELIALVAGVLFVCRERMKAFGVAGRMKYIDLRSSAPSILAPSSSSLITSLDLRVRSELHVSIKDEYGDYRELEYLFD